MPDLQAPLRAVPVRVDGDPGVHELRPLAVQVPMTPRSLGGGGAAIVFPDARGREVEVRTTSVSVASPARARETCASCRAIQRAMLEDPASAQPQTCETCGAEYLYRAPTRERVRAPRPIGIGPRPEVQVTAFVRDLLALHLAQVRSESTTSSGKFVVQRGESSTASILRMAESGIVGNGCKGTKGTWAGAPQEPREVDAVPVDAASERRFAQLGGPSRETALAILADGQGDRVASETVAGKTHELTLEQRLGLRLADEITQRRWLKHVRHRDTGPMLAGSAELGATRLRAAAGAWWAA